MTDPSSSKVTKLPKKGGGEIRQSTTSIFIGHRKYLKRERGERERKRREGAREREEKREGRREGESARA